MSANMAGRQKSKDLMDDMFLNNNNGNAFPCGYNLYNRMCMLDERTATNIKCYLTMGNLCENLIINNEEQYLEIAIQMKDDKLIDKIENVLIRRINENCCVDMFQLAITFELGTLQKMTEFMIYKNMDILCESSQIESLGQCVIQKLVESPLIRDHPATPKAIEHWYKYEREPRVSYRNKMVEHVELHAQRYTPPLETNNNVVTYNVFFSIDKGTQRLNVTVLDINKPTQKSVSLKEIPRLDSGFAVCCRQIDEDDPPFVLISGGRSTPRSVFCCDIVEGSQKKCSKKLNRGRSFHSMAAVGHNIFVLGGVDKGEPVASIELRERKSHTWKEVGELQVPVHKAACCVHKGNIYMFGGETGNGIRTKSIQKYDTLTRRVSLESELPFAVSKSRVVVMDDCIYLVTKGHDTIRYCPQSKEIHRMQASPVSSKYMALFSDGVEIYLAGGSESDRTHAYAFRLMRDTGTWQQTTLSLKNSICDSRGCSMTIPTKYSNSVVPFA